MSAAEAAAAAAVVVVVSPSSFLCRPHYLRTGQDSSVGIVTRHGLDGPGSNSGAVWILRTSPDRPWGPPNLPFIYTGSLSRSKADGLWR